MATYPPPQGNPAQFDSALFTTNDDFLTIEEANGRYLKFPFAQGAENLQQTTINGVLNANSTATFNDIVTIADGSNVSTIEQTALTLDIENIVPSGTINIAADNISFTTPTLPTTTAVLPPANDNSTKLSTTAWVQQAIAAAGGSGNNGWSLNIANSTTQTSYDVLVGGPGNLRTSTFNGTINTNTLGFDTATANTSLTTPLINGVSNTLGLSSTNINLTGTTDIQGSLKVSDVTTGTKETTISQANNILTISNGENSGEVIVSVKDSVGTTSNIIDAVSNNLTINSDNISLNGSNPPTSNSTQPVFTDSSTKIPTTTWVQGAIPVKSGWTYTSTGDKTSTTANVEIGTTAPSGSRQLTVNGAVTTTELNTPIIELPTGSVASGITVNNNLELGSGVNLEFGGSSGLIKGVSNIEGHSNVDMNIRGKGTGDVVFTTHTGGSDTEALRIYDNNQVVNVSKQLAVANSTPDANACVHVKTDATKHTGLIIESPFSSGAFIRQKTTGSDFTNGVSHSGWSIYPTAGASSLNVNNDGTISYVASSTLGNSFQLLSENTTNGGFQLDLDGVNKHGYLMNNESGARIGLFTNGGSGAQERLTVLGSGNVGINKTTPAYALDVSGDVNCSGAFRVNGTPIGGGGGSSQWVSASDSLGNYIYYQDTTVDNTSVLIGSNTRSTVLTTRAATLEVINKGTTVPLAFSVSDDTQPDTSYFSINNTGKVFINVGPSAVSDILTANGTVNLSSAGLAYKIGGTSIFVNSIIAVNSLFLVASNSGVNVSATPVSGAIGRMSGRWMGATLPLDGVSITLTNSSDTILVRSSNLTTEFLNAIGTNYKALFQRTSTHPGPWYSTDGGTTYQQALAVLDETAKTLRLRASNGGAFGAVTISFLGDWTFTYRANDVLS